MGLLLVEDEPRIVEVLRAAFVRAHFAIDAAATAGQAHELLQTVAYGGARFSLHFRAS